MFRIASIIISCCDIKWFCYTNDGFVLPRCRYIADGAQDARNNGQDGRARTGNRALGRYRVAPIAFGLASASGLPFTLTLRYMTGLDTN